MPSRPLSFRDNYGRARAFLLRDLWFLPPQSGMKGRLLHFLRMLVLTIEGAIRNDLFLLSAALTYKMIFALVPLLAVMLALLKGFGGLASASDKLKTFLLRYMAPDTGGEVARQIDTFIGNIDAAAIGIFGFILLVYTSLSLMYTVEQAFNRIWGIRTPRPVLRRFSIYWTLLTIGPVVAALSLGMSTFVQNQGLYQWLTGIIPLLGTFTLKLAPFLFGWALFLAMYSIMPNTRVEFRAALVGALCAGTTWEFMKDIYVWYNSHVVSSQSFYGSLGSIPVFLLWIYLSWVIVLSGAEISFAVQNVRTYRREVEQSDINPRHRERLALFIALRALRPFLKGEIPPTAVEIAGDLNAPVRTVHEVTMHLVRQGLLREASSPDRKDPGLIPARDPDALSVRDVLDALRSSGDPCPLADGKRAAELDQLLGNAEQKSMEPLSKARLRDLV